MNNKVLYLPGLNGLRAIAALAVVFSHTNFDLASFHLNPYIFGTTPGGQPKGLDLAGYGVSIFFALSGFLITYLLQTEKEKSGISVKNFYVRRILRIWPLYYLYFGIALLIIVFTGSGYNLKSILLYTFYAPNFAYLFLPSLALLGHYWSLGVEEQFYLFWPWLNKFVKSGLVNVLVILIIIFTGTKLLLHFLYPFSVAESIIHVTRFHCMMIGALGAVLFKNGNILFMKIADNKLTQSLSLVVVLLICINSFHVASVLDQEIVSIISVLIMVGQINVKNRIINLDREFFDFTGKISYGIYVYHPLIIYALIPVLNIVPIDGFGKYILVFGSVIIITIMVSYLSYKYFESYFLNLKRKFSSIASSGTKHYKPDQLINNKI